MKGTIIFVHGMCHGAWCWEENYIPYFEAMGYTCIAFDLPGHSNVGNEKRIYNTVQDYVRALREIVDTLNHDPILIGHSMGGWVIQSYLKKGRCKKAILLASVPPAGVLATSIRLLWNKPNLLRFLVQRNILGVFKHEINRLMRSDLGPAKIAYYQQKLCAESFIAYLQLCIPIFNRSKIRTFPILVVGGTNDLLFTTRDFENTAATYQARLVIIEQGTHELLLDPNYSASASAIAEFMEA